MWACYTCSEGPMILRVISRLWQCLGSPPSMNYFQTEMIQQHPLKISANTKQGLVGGFNPFEKYDRQNGNLPQIGVNIKNLWNHQPQKHCQGYGWGFSSTAALPNSMGARVSSLCPCSWHPNHWLWPRSVSVSPGGRNDKKLALLTKIYNLQSSEKPTIIYKILMIYYRKEVSKSDLGGINLQSSVIF